MRQKRIHGGGGGTLLRECLRLPVLFGLLLPLRMKRRLNKGEVAKGGA